VVGGAVVRAGTCSWADRGLIADGRFYPRRTMSARERLAWYCQKLPLAEITTTYRFPPTPDVAHQWAQRTLPGFLFDVRAWSLLGGNPTFPDSLWVDLQAAVPAHRRDQRRLYPSHLPADVLEECWARFAHALGPLRAADRLGAVIVPYPSWFTPRPEAWAELAALRRRLTGVAVAVELHSPRWFTGDSCEATLELLEELGLSLVCVDGPATGPRALPPVVAATAPLAVVRFCGRRAVEGEPWTWPHRYSREELAEWVPRVADLASSATEVHLLMDNGWRSDAVEGAGALLDLLAAAL
jgi:uncharacterized protein YecE (DUF72 family)